MAKNKNKNKIDDPNAQRWARLKNQAQSQLDAQHKKLLETKAAAQQLARTNAEERASLRKELRYKNQQLGMTAAQYEAARTWVDQALVRVKDQGSVERRVAVDWGGGFLGSVLFQALSLAARRGLGPKPGESPTGWLAKNSSWVYDAILAVLGVVGYGAELGTRPQVTMAKDGQIVKDDAGRALPYMPSELREMASEISKVVGLSSFNRALSVYLDTVVWKQS